MCKFTSFVTELADRSLDFHKQDFEHTATTKRSLEILNNAPLPPLKRHKSDAAAIFNTPSNDDIKVVRASSSVHTKGEDTRSTATLIYQRYLIALYAHKAIPSDDKLNWPLLSSCKKYVRLAIIRYHESSYSLKLMILMNSLKALSVVQ